MRFDLADTRRLTDRGNGAHSQNKVKIVSFPIAFGIGLAKNVVDEVDCTTAWFAPHKDTRIAVSSARATVCHRDTGPVCKTSKVGGRAKSRRFQSCI